MELPSIIVATRALLREGETGRALQTILPALESDPRHASALHTLQVLAANYNATRQQEIKGILSFPEAQRIYSQVNDGVFSALEALESGRQPTGLAGLTANNPPLWRRPGMVVVLLLLGGLGFWFYRSMGSRPPQKNDLATVNCPTFKGSGPKVLILPFKQVGQGTAKPEDIIQFRIQDRAKKRNFPISTQVLRDLDANFDSNDSEALCRHCAADMVIWGLYDYADSVNVDLQFFTLHNPQGAFSTGFQAFRNLPEIQKGQLLNKLDDAIFGICGILATRTGNAEVARAWFDKMEKKGEAVQKTEQILHGTGQ